MEEPQGQSEAGSYMETLKRIWREAPPGAWDDIPTDLALNYKHYLYGLPKKDA